jgi:outer membrane protein OmpA-like peptidoglycan-associated protein
VGCNCTGEGEPEIQIVEKLVEDPDPDRDDVKGDKDQCPHDPEDKDGFEDEDGCPEWDNDQDTVHDACDKCPETKEVLNGVDDEDGCPDESLARIDVEKQEIVILDKIYFDLDKDTIKQASNPVLDAVFNVMASYPAIERVEIQGHTDSRAPDDYNLDLSQRRADEAMRYLVDKGIEADRLEAKGYGETEPIVPDAEAEEDHSKNRRVQFLILKVAEDGPIIRHAGEAQPSAPEE